MIGVKVTIECEACGSKTVHREPDMYSLLEETVFYADCMRYDEDNEYKEYCSNRGKRWKPNRRTK